MCAPVEQPSKRKVIWENVPDANKSLELEETFPQVMVLLLSQAVRQQSYEETFSGLQMLFLIFQFCKFYWVVLPLFCICPFSIEVLDKSSGDIYHCITSYSTDKAVHLFLPPLCSQRLQAFLRHPSAMCFCRNKKPQNSEFGFPLYFLFS